MPLLTSVVVGSGIAYDACHDTGEALLATYSFRTTNGPGQQGALGRYPRSVFDRPPADRAEIVSFDELMSAGSVLKARELGQGADGGQGLRHAGR